MPINWKAIIPSGTYLTTDYVQLYLASSLIKRATVTELRLHNNDVQERTPTVRLVPNGDTPSDVHIILSDPIPAGQTYKDSTFLVLVPGDSIYVKADVAGMITINANGMEQS